MTPRRETLPSYIAYTQNPIEKTETQQEMIDLINKLNSISKKYTKTQSELLAIRNNLLKEVDCLSTENLNISQEVTHTKNLLNRKEEKKAIVLGELWAIHFPKFKYMNKKQFLKEVVRYDLDTRLVLYRNFKIFSSP